MRRYIQLLGEYFAQYAKVRVSYRGDFLISLGTSFAATIFSLAFVLVLFSKAPSLGGWSRDEEIFLYGFSLIPFGLYNILSLNIYEFGNSYIIEGKFDRVLLRPIAALFQVLFEAFRLESLQEVATGVFCVVWAARRLHLQWTAADAVLMVFWAAGGAVIYISFFTLLSTISFWFEDRIGVHPPIWNVIAFGRYPLSIYSGAIQFLLSWIVPFAFASFYPSVRLLGRAQFHAYALYIPLVAAACLTVTLFSWSRGVRHYSSTGS
ncbi:MAG: ABC transporter permease [Candidatus Acidiferrales bacterium]